VNDSITRLLQIRKSLSPDSIQVRLKENTKSIKLFLTLLTLLVAGIMAGYSTTAAKSPDVSDNIRKSLDQAGRKDVSVDEDRDKGS
jgi:hypothetical protein